MAILSFAQIRGLRPVILASLLPLLILACAGHDLPRYDGGPVALKIRDDWKLEVVEPTDGFLNTVDRNAKDFAEKGGLGTGAVGCVAAGLAVVIYIHDTTGVSGVLGCVAGGVALYPVGYVVGYGTGAVVGTVQGTVNAFSSPGDDIDMQPLFEAFEGVTPSGDLARAMQEQARQIPDLTFARDHGPGESPAVTPPGDRQPAFELRLTITRLRLTTDTGAPPASRLHIAVVGRLRDVASGQEIGDGDWRYVSEPRATATLAANGASALAADLAAGWRALAEEIVRDLFKPDG